MKITNRILSYIDEEESKYQKFFRKMLKKYGVNSLKELSDEEKKKFFNEIDRKYKGKKETD